MTAEEATRLVGLFAEGERLCQAGKALAARRVEQTNCWRRDGHRSAAHFLAAATASPLADASGGSGRRPRATVHVRVDHAALVRGRTEGDETCDIPGVGPIPVGTARMLASDSMLKVLVTKGVDVVGVAHAGRTIPAHLRSALVERDPCCVVPGCDAREGLEIDHVVGIAEKGPTALNNLARLCRWHHMAKTHHGYRLGGGPGLWSWIPPPDEPDG